MGATIRRRLDFRPFAQRGRKTIAAVLALFALFFASGTALSLRAISRSQHRVPVLEVAARQRTLAVRYVNDVLLVRSGGFADPAGTAVLLQQSAAALLDGGTAPEVPGDDDETALSAATWPDVRAQLAQEEKLVADLTATGRAILSGNATANLPETAGEHIATTDPVQRLRILSAITANVSLDAARTIGTHTDDSIGSLEHLEFGLGIIGLVLSVLLGWALIATTRRQTAHFRSLVRASTDLVLVLSVDGCRYASESVVAMLGEPEARLLGAEFWSWVHPDDATRVQMACEHGAPHELVFRLRNAVGEWRSVEAHLTDRLDDRAIRGVVVNARDVTDRLRLEAALTRNAFHDGLTGLPNRALFRDRLEQALARSARSTQPLAVMIVDLDGFKQVNDSLGHDAGDRLLETVATRFQSATRQSDTLARLGGDEFALLLDGGVAEAEASARRLLASLEEHIDAGGRDVSVGASIGIAVRDGETYDGEELLRYADVAMYAAKEAGRGRYEVFREDMSRQLGELLGLEHELRTGLQRGEFVVYYQPAVDLTTNAVVGVEALVRWHSPKRGLVPPDRFIPVAESTGLIHQLGEFVLHEACRQTARWNADGLVHDDFVTWVNVSARQLGTGRIPTVVREALLTSGLEAGHFGIEITETTIVADGATGERARAELQDVHDLGVRIALDDFGTGFSSLAQLRRFPIDVIKVDRSFIQGAEHDTRDAAITANVASLAHSLGIVAVAEGIETDVHLASAREFGCDTAQGYLFARPAPADEIRALLEASHVVPAADRRGEDDEQAPKLAS